MLQCTSVTILQRDFVSKFAFREEHKASWFHNSLIRQNLYCVISEADFLISTLIKSY